MLVGSASLDIQKDRVGSGKSNDRGEPAVGYR